MPLIAMCLLDKPWCHQFPEASNLRCDEAQIEGMFQN